jgi:hypothetical protein
LLGRKGRGKEVAGRGEDCGCVRLGEAEEKEGRKEGEGVLTGGTRVSATAGKKEKEAETRATAGGA